MNVCPILLAAGQSQRFGSDKLLHPLSYQQHTRPLILHTIASWLAVFTELNIVIREDNVPLLELLSQCEFNAQIKLISAIDANKGMSASLMTGIEANADADAWLIGLADMPFIDKQVISQSNQALEDGAILTQSEYDKVRGHPVGFTSRFFEDLLSLEGDKGARQILASNSELITVIQSPDDGIYRDIDTISNLTI